MAKKTVDGFLCPVCEKKYANAMHADSCRDSHDLLYIPMTRTEVNRLLNAFFIGDTSLIPDTLIETLRKVQRANVTQRI